MGENIFPSRKEFSNNFENNFSVEQQLKAFFGQKNFVFFFSLFFFSLNFVESFNWRQSASPQFYMLAVAVET